MASMANRSFSIGQHRGAFSVNPGMGSAGDASQTDCGGFGDSCIPENGCCSTRGGCPHLNFKSFSRLSDAVNNVQEIELSDGIHGWQIFFFFFENYFCRPPRRI